ncbi:hypothetical protein, partial [Vibrio hibernica]|uniref:hypothetical protein n=1 Tax=Vibrio hibernica TaxID=2587465 RepID=UPI0039B0AFD5
LIDADLRALTIKQLATHENTSHCVSYDSTINLSDDDGRRLYLETRYNLLIQNINARLDDLVS